MGLTGRAYVFTYHPFLRSSTHTVSASAATTVNLELAFPIQAANDPYKVLLSAAGKGPSGFGIPLTRDQYAKNSFVEIYPFASFTNLHGSLDTNAQATASFTTPANIPPSLIGQSFWLAAVTYQSPRQLDFSSAAVAFQIVP